VKEQASYLPPELLATTILPYVKFSIPKVVKMRTSCMKIALINWHSATVSVVNGTAPEQS